MHAKPLKGLQQKYELEQDPGKKRVILEPMLGLIQSDWEELFASLTKEEHPHKLLRLLAELNRSIRIVFTRIQSGPNSDTRTTRSEFTEPNLRSQFISAAKERALPGYRGGGKRR